MTITLTQDERAHIGQATRVLIDLHARLAANPSAQVNIGTYTNLLAPGVMVDQIAALVHVRGVKIS